MATETENKISKQKVEQFGDLDIKISHLDWDYLLDRDLGILKSAIELIERTKVTNLGAWHDQGDEQHDAAKKLADDIGAFIKIVGAQLQSMTSGEEIVMVGGLIATYATLINIVAYMPQDAIIWAIEMKKRITKKEQVISFDGENNRGDIWWCKQCQYGFQTHKMQDPVMLYCPYCGVEQGNIIVNRVIMTKNRC